MTILLDGKKVRDEIRETLRAKIESFSSTPPRQPKASWCGGKPTLVIIQVGDNEESTAYIKQKKLFGKSIGAKVDHRRLPAEVSQAELSRLIGALNADFAVHGIIVQMPIPEELDCSRIVDVIAPEKDVDGLGSVNLKALWEGRGDGLMPATTKGILALLDYYKIPIVGKRAVVVGRSTLVGKPTALALLNRDATVTVVHSKTKELSQLTRAADILVVAAGKPHFIQEDDVKPEQTVIDVGITAVTGERLNEEVEETSDAASGKKTLAGDVQFDTVKPIVGAISPVPGGVGPMTVASLFQNLVSAYERQIS